MNLRQTAICCIGVALSVTAHPLWMQQHQEQQQQSSRMDSMTRGHEGLQGVLGLRGLQSLLDPVAVCEQFALLDETYENCVCARSGNRDVSVDCDFKNEVCASTDEGVESCFTGSFGVILNAQGLPRAVTTCTDITTSTEPLLTCVQTIPTVEGDFRELESCTATLNDDPCTCTLCSLSEADRMVNQTRISLDCCSGSGVKKVQTCGPVDGSGSTAVNYDFVEKEEQGQCSSADNVGASQSVAPSVMPTGPATLAPSAPAIAPSEQPAAPLSGCNSVWSFLWLALPSLQVVSSLY